MSEEEQQPDKTELQTEKTDETPQNVDLDTVMQKFNDKLTEITDRYDKKIDELTKSVSEKDAEIAKLRKVNSDILMSADLGKKNENIDFSTVDFDEVDWDKEAAKLFKTIDSRLS